MKKKIFLDIRLFENTFYYRLLPANESTNNIFFIWKKNKNLRRYDGNNEAVAHTSDKKDDEEEYGKDHVVDHRGWLKLEPIAVNVVQVGFDKKTWLLPVRN